MGMYYNNGTIRTPKQIWYNSPSVGLKQIKEVYWNVGGSPKRVWPEDQVAYNGSTFDTLLSGGMKTNCNFYTFEHNVNTGWTGKERWIGANRSYSDGAVTNTIITSGALKLDYNEGLSTGGYSKLFGYVSVNTIDFTIYKKLIIGVIYYSHEYCYTYAPDLHLNFINTSKNNGYYITAEPDNTALKNTNISNTSVTFTPTDGVELSTGAYRAYAGYYTIDVTSLTGDYYIVLRGEAFFNSTNNNQYRQWHGAFTKIEFKTS